MKFKNYIISFCAGSSGRFVRSLLDRIIKNSEEPILLDDQNSAHDNVIPLDFDLSWDECDMHHPDVFKYLTFLSSNSIFATHTYPNFGLIEEKFKDVGVILIQFDLDDCKEIQLNSWAKNKRITDPSELQKPLIKFEFELSVQSLKRRYTSFIHTYSINENNCMVLKYKEIYEKVGESYMVIEKLRQFSEVNIVPNCVLDACNRYSMGRNQLLKQAGLR